MTTPLSKDSIIRAYRDYVKAANDKLYAFGKTWLEGGSIEDARK